ncbi:MAG TPA: LamG domain-containing protein, partial [Bryobacteraceae bacterium]|nr:LamG domain-containing protein [Bryobacteraceae bacterium]
STPVSADYYGLFAAGIGKLIGADDRFVGILSQGTSGDQMWMDYGKPKSDITLEQYAQGVAGYAYRAYQKIRYRDWVPIGMAETTLTLQRRLADTRRLAWARETAARINGQKPKTQAEVYALEQIYLHEQPVRELKLQAVRMGDLGITAIPDEVFALSGLKLKAQSPFPATFHIELANGAEGYIPPPEQHKLGGYTTWAARTAGLDVQAEPKIVETLLELLEQVAGKPRRKPEETNGPYARAVLRSKPAAYWRMTEFAGTEAADASGNQRPATYEDGVAFFLPGPESAGFSGTQVNRAVHFAGGRMLASVPGLAADYTIEFWFWNGLPNTARSITGYLAAPGGGPALAIGGTGSSPGRLTLGGAAGTTEIQPKTWNHVAMVQQGGRVSVYLNGNRKPELAGQAGGTPSDQIYVGGSQDREFTFEGKIDEVAVFGHALTEAEIASHYQAAGI